MGGPQRERAPGLRPALAAIAALALIVCVAGCGSSGSSEAAEVRLVIGTTAAPEDQILGQIYLQALGSAGFRAKQVTVENPPGELGYGRISAYPAHAATLLRELGVGEEELPTDGTQAYRRAKQELAAKRLTAFPPTPYNYTRVVGMLRETAEPQHLKTISDLKGKSEKMTMLGPTDCHFAYDCLAGIERNYHIYFESISYTYTPRDIANRYRYLEQGKFDAVIFNDTEGRLLTEKKKFVTLEDDRNLFPAGNTMFVTREKLAEAGGPKLEHVIVAAQKGLTLPLMQRLDAEVELEHQKPAKVAAEYLKQLRM